MSKALKQDICGLDTPGIFLTDVERSQVEQSLPPEVQYACLYWVKHLQKSGAQIYDNDQVHKFLQVHLLHWLEALSWMRMISDGILAIISLGSIASVSLLWPPTILQLIVLIRLVTVLNSASSSRMQSDSPNIVDL